MHKFSLIDLYLGTILDMDASSLQPGDCSVTETARRLRCEQSYGYVHALYGIFFTDGRTAISVTPGARAAVIALLQRSPPDPSSVFDQGWLASLTTCVNEARSQAGLSPARGSYEGRLYACNASLLREYNQKGCHQLRDERIPPAEGLSLPAHCFPDGIVYGIVEDDRIVSVAYAHRTGKMEDRVADLGVETAAPYRKRGYARAVVSAVTAHITSSGGEAVYSCSVPNQASIATASSVGYVLYGRTMVITAPAPDEGEDQ